jgi:hypothetical protein
MSFGFHVLFPVEIKVELLHVIKSSSEKAINCCLTEWVHYVADLFGNLNFINHY